MAAENMPKTTSPPSNVARVNLVKMLNTPPFATRVTAQWRAFVVDTLTENVNRTAPQIRSIFDKAGGNMGKPGSVSFGFDEVSLVIVPAEGLDEEKAMEIALEAGAEDVQTSEGVFEITGPRRRVMPSVMPLSMPRLSRVHSSGQ